jgi:hypothetical protein
MNVMHDGNHGSYSQELGEQIYGWNHLCTAGNVYNWQVQQCATPHLY